MSNNDKNPEDVKIETNDKHSSPAVKTNVSKPNSSGPAIGRLRRAARRAEADKLQLQRNLPNRTKVTIEGSSIIVTEFVSVNRKEFRHEIQLPMGESFALFGDMFSELMGLNRQIITGRDVNQRLPTRLTGPDGKFTKDPMKDPEGNILFLLNHYDKLKFIFKQLDNAPEEIKELLKKLSEYLKGIQFPQYTTKK